MTDPPPEPTRQTRAQRRAGRSKGPAVVPAVPELPGQPLVSAAVVALTALVTVSGFAGAPLVAASLTFAAGILAWGWPGLLGLPSPRGTVSVLAVASVASMGTAVLTRTDPFLRWLPAAIAGSMIVAFLHQLGRRDGRPRLVESIASTITGVAVIVSGASMVPLPLTLGGEWVIAIAMSAVAASALTDLLGRRPGLRTWLLPLGMLAGVLAGMAVGRSAPGISWGEAALLGVVPAGVSHAVRRVLSLLPAVSGVRSQLVSACASVLTCGSAVYVVGRLFVA